MKQTDLLITLAKIGLPDGWEAFFTILAGLGIFLVGIKFMGDGLKLLAGDKLKYFIDKYTSNPLMGLLVGILVTIALQSSSGTTALTISLVSVGLMTLPQAIGVIMGANIGTTVTSFLIGLNIGEFSLPVLAIGAFLLMFAKGKKANYLGMILFGFGALFFGLGTMSAPLKEISKEAWFSDMMLNLASNPVMAWGVGTVFTFIVQSSSATIGIVQELYESGAMPLEVAIPMVFGDNIGTTITAILAAIGGSLAAKRAATAHVLFNVIGSIIFMILLYPFIAYIEWLTAMFGLEPKMQIAIAHASFNITLSLLLIWFVRQIAAITKVIFKGEDEEEIGNVFDVKLIDQSPSYAIEHAKLMTLKMGKIAERMLNDIYKIYKTKDNKLVSEVKSAENMINTLEKKVKEYLIIITSKDIPANEAEMIRVLMQTSKDYERMGDHLENLLDFLEELNSTKKFELDEGSYKDLKIFFKQVKSCLESCNQAFESNDKDLAKEVTTKENEIDDLFESIRTNHINRIEKKEVTNTTIITSYVDILSDLERISDHCSNISKYIIGNRKIKEIDYTLLDSLIEED